MMLLYFKISGHYSTVILNAPAVISFANEYFRHKSVDVDVAANVQNDRCDMKRRQLFTRYITILGGMSVVYTSSN